MPRRHAGATLAWLFSKSRPELRRPLFPKLRPVDLLESLDAGALVTRGDAFVVHDLGARLVDDAIAQRAHAETQIRIFVVGRPVRFREAAQSLEQLPTNEQRRARNVIGIAQEVVSRIVGIFGMADVPPGRIAPEDVAGFLQPAVRIDAVSRPPTPIVGSPSAVVTRCSSQPPRTTVSLLRKHTYRPRAIAAPRLHARTNPSFLPLRT